MYVAKVTVERFSPFTYLRAGWFQALHEEEIIPVFIFGGADGSIPICMSCHFLSREISSLGVAPLSICTFLHIIIISLLMKRKNHNKANASSRVTCYQLSLTG